MRQIGFSGSTFGTLAISISIASALLLAGCTERGSNSVSPQEESVVQGEVSGQQGLAKSEEPSGPGQLGTADGGQSGFVGVQGAIVTLAEVEDASCSALTSNIQSLSAGISFSIAQSSALVRAALAGQAVLSEMQAGGASLAEISSTDSTNAALLARLDLAVSSSELSSAFEEYHAAIMEQLLDMDSSDSSAVSSADAQLEAAGGAGSVLSAALNSAATTGAIVQAYMTFYYSVSTLISGIGGMDSPQLDATTQILMILDSNA